MEYLFTEIILNDYTFGTNVIGYMRTIHPGDDAYLRKRTFNQEPLSMVDEP